MGQAIRDRLQAARRYAPFAVPFAGAMMGCLTGMAFSRGHRVAGTLCLAGSVAMAYAAGVLLPARADGVGAYAGYDRPAPSGDSLAVNADQARGRRMPQPRPTS